MKNKKKLIVDLHFRTAKKYALSAKDEGMNFAAFVIHLIALGWEVYQDQKSTLIGRLKEGHLKP